MRSHLNKLTSFFTLQAGSDCENVVNSVASDIVSVGWDGISDFLTGLPLLSLRHHRRSL